MDRPFLWRPVALAGVALVLAFGGHVAAEQQLPGPVAPDATMADLPQQFSGFWDYNADQSVNAATGRPEQGPQSAASRAPGRGGRSSDGASSADGGSSSRSPIRGAPTLTANMIYQTQSFVRDMLEVPEALDLRVTSGAVTFLDDLARERTYPTDGKNRGYRLSAAQYEAKVFWEGQQLKRELTGGGGITIFETYFLSDDGQRMFVVVRIKVPRRAQFAGGFNRVYDRVADPNAVGR